MNIKSVASPIIQNDPVAKKQETKTFDANKDRDPQQGNAGGNEQHESFTEEDVQKAWEYLKNHPGVKKNNLTVTLETKNEVRIFFVKDYSGKVVRRLDLYDAIQSSRASTTDTKDQRGGLLNKAM